MTNAVKSVGATDYLSDEANFRRFVQFILVLIAAAICFSAVGMVLTPQLDWGRVVNAACYGAVVLYSWIGLRHSASRAVARLTLGLWVLNTSTVVLYAGIHSLNVTIYPFLIAFSAWVLGTRWLLAMTGATMTALVGVSVAEYLGVLQPTPRVPPLHAAATVCAVLMVITALVHAAYSSFMKSQLRVAELNDSLSKLVAERTTALEQTTEALQHSREELVRSEGRATIATLVASVSHELNTPLGVSLTAASTLVDTSARFQKLVDENQLKRSSLVEFVAQTREGSDMMQRNLQRAVDLMSNFRQVANDQASEQHRIFDLYSVVDEVLQTLSPVLKRTSHQVVVEVPEGITMESYPGPLGQVVINLVNNALLHAFEGRTDGVLTIRSSTPEPSLVQLDFEDNGKGMSPEVQDHLFDAFFSTKKGQGGTGLGMSIVQNLVTTTLGGEIRFESAPGVGTRFIITLPLSVPVRVSSQFGQFQ